MAFESGGTIVAAWTNYGGAAYAVRGPGATSFGAQQPLGPVGEQTYGIDLAPTAQGGVAATWSSAGQIRAAVKPAGGSFGDAPSVLPSSSQIAEQPVVAADLGGGKQTIGYGAAELATPVAIAASADRTIAVWRDVSSALAAATRSEQAPASNGPGAAPAAPDRTKPKVTLRAPQRLTVTRSTRSIAFTVSCDEACSLMSTGNMRTTRRGKRVVSPLRSFTSKTPKRGRQTVRLNLGPLAQKDLRRALASARGGRVFFDVTATDAASNATRVRGEITLKARKARR